ncbi:MAG: radical SAM family heme chaperone HemW [Gammaproteobacteria bacterium]|nr:radical SAM family heme chaperone HemW [Gammaproteobacteria bacterium]
MTAPALTLPPVALYIHIPWCLKKCPYCDFNSHANDRTLPEAAYIEKLIADLEQDLPYLQGRKFTSIFIGGGTPSLFSPAGIEKLLTAVENLAGFASDIEITLEANPGTFELEKFSAFRSAGINRLSIGIQSFQQSFLEKLGRAHSDKEALTAAENALSAGFENFNLDLMFGLPGQSIEEALKDLEMAIACNPPHLSWYQLTIEPNTLFYSKPPSLPNDDLVSGIQEAGIDLLSSHGLDRYEVSAFCGPDQESRHNLNYWLFGDYLGIGAGAHGKITLPEENLILRTQKVRQPDNYLQQENPVAEVAKVQTSELPLEFMMNVLRLSKGCDQVLFGERTGLALQSIEPVLASLRDKNLLRNDRLQATSKGFLFLDTVLTEFTKFMPGDNHTLERIEVNSR